MSEAVSETVRDTAARTPRVPAPGAAPAARARGGSQAREALAEVLRRLGDSQTPSAGDRVRFTYRDGSALEGVWTFVGDRGESGPFAVRCDDGTLRAPRPGHVRCDVAKGEVALLTVGEVVTIAALLEEFAALCPGHPLGPVAEEHLRAIHERFPLARERALPGALPEPRTPGGDPARG